MEFIDILKCTFYMNAIRFSTQINRLVDRFLFLI